MVGDIVIIYNGVYHPLSLSIALVFQMQRTQPASQQVSTCLIRLWLVPLQQRIRSKTQTNIEYL